MSEKKKEICTVVSQESIGTDIYSMWLQTEKIAAEAKPGQFVSLYTNDPSKLLPRPISLCEIDKEKGRIHLVYRVTGALFPCSLAIKVRRSQFSSPGLRVYASYTATSSIPAFSIILLIVSME